VSAGAVCAAALGVASVAAACVAQVYVDEPMFVVTPVTASSTGVYKTGHDMVANGKWLDRSNWPWTIKVKSGVFSAATPASKSSCGDLGTTQTEVVSDSTGKFTAPFKLNVEGQRQGNAFFCLLPGERKQLSEVVGGSFYIDHFNEGTISPAITIL
jgi:hypothetical protein